MNKDEKSLNNYFFFPSHLSLSKHLQFHVKDLFFSLWSVYNIIRSLKAGEDHGKGRAARYFLFGLLSIPFWKACCIIPSIHLLYIYWVSKDSIVIWFFQLKVLQIWEAENDFLNFLMYSLSKITSLFKMLM